MNGIFIDKEKCIACGACILSCESEALSITDGYAEADKDKCAACGRCIDTCPMGAIELKKDYEAASDLNTYKNVWVMCGYADGEFEHVSFELLGKGRELANALNCELCAFVIGNKGVYEKAGELCYYGADTVLVCEDDKYPVPVEERYTDILVREINSRRPEIVLFGATEFGRSFAPRAAARLNTGLTADCTVLDIDPKKKLLRQTRPAFGGNLMATILCPNHRPQMATVRPGIMKALERENGRKVNIVKIAADSSFDLKKILSVSKSDSDKHSIADAKIIVSAGRGIGSKANLAYVKELAELLHGEYGVSRPLIDLGWSEYEHQIGQTGCTVAPDILITCGISGAIQHLAGIANARTVIAINTDPTAPIMSRADYVICGDCVSVLKELIAEIKNG